MAHLPINLKIIGRSDGGVTVATESGHLFTVPADTTPKSAADGMFSFDPADWTRDDGLHPEMTRALLNEIIGAPIAACGNDEKTA